MSYQPPSQSGGEDASTSGAYTPPPSGGYSVPPPPPSGGYTPPDGGGYGSSSMPPGGGDPSNLAHLPQSYMNAVLKPSAETYEREIPNGSWVKVLLGVALVALLGFITNLLLSGYTQASMEQARQQFIDQGLDPSVPPFNLIFELQESAGNPIFSLLLPFVTFFLGAGLLFLLAKIFGSKRSNFMDHAYLLSLSYVPVRVVMSLVSLLSALGPALGCLVSIIVLCLYLYQLFCAGCAIQASHRMEGGRAQLSAFSSIPVLLLLICCVGIIGAVALGPSFSEAISRLATPTPR